MKLEQSLIDRRQFLDGVIVAGAAGLGVVGAYTAMGSLIGAEEREPEKALVNGKALEALAKDKFVLVPFGPAPVIVFTLPDGTLRALSGLCTHSRCNVRYRPAENDLYCACHQGRYMADGTNVPGTPPPRPLGKYNVERLADGTICVTPIKAATQRADTKA
jgi:Rieske Fe-S protein